MSRVMMAGDFLINKIMIRMKKSILFSMLLLGSLLSKAQNPQYYNTASSTVINNYPLSSTIYNKAQWIFGPNQFNAAGTGSGAAAYLGNITKIFVRLGNTVSINPYTNFVISLSQNVGTTTAFGTVANASYTFVTGMTPCFTQPSGFTLAGAVANSWYGFNLTSAFPYNPNLSLVVEIKVSGGSGNGIRLATGSGAPQRLYGAYASASGTNATGALNFGFNMVTTPLPVSFVHFDGYKGRDADILRWGTSCEINNSYFNIQHSTDGIHFNLIEKVNSKADGGNCSTPLEYEAANTKPSIGHNYYKLSQTDIDGKLNVHSNLVDLFRTADGKDILLYPNPAKSLVTLDLNMPDFSELTIRINDMNGRIVKQVKTNVQPGSNQVPIDIYQLRTANYMLQVLDKDDVIFTTKVTKE